MSKVLDKVEELRKLIQDVYGVVSNIDIWVHHNDNPGMTDDRAKAIRDDIAGDDMKRGKFDDSNMYRAEKDYGRVEVFVSFPVNENNSSAGTEELPENENINESSLARSGDADNANP